MSAQPIESLGATLIPAFGMALTALSMRPTARRGGLSLLTTAALWAPWMIWHLTLGIFFNFLWRASRSDFIHVGATILILLVLPTLALLAALAFQVFDWWHDTSYSPRSGKRRFGEVYTKPIGFAILAACSLAGWCLGSQMDIYDSPSIGGRYQQT